VASRRAGDGSNFTAAQTTAAGVRPPGSSWESLKETADREAYRGGENKSDRGDALVIADQLRMRWRSLQEIRPKDDTLAEMHALVGHRRDLIQDQSRRIARLRSLLLEICPALWRRRSTSEPRGCTAGRHEKVATPASIRRLGEARLARWLKDRGVRKSRVLAQHIVAAAKAQKCELPAAEVKAALVAEIALEVLCAPGSGSPPSTIARRSS
jgi:hypothetical protein